MASASENGSPAYSRVACLACRKGKRRCDRKTPTCELCAKREVPCRYPPRRVVPVEPDPTPAPDWSTSKAPSSAADWIESSAAAIHFLAPQLFRQTGLALPRPEVPIPAEVAAFLGDNASVRSTAETFFAKVHRWFPIVHKRGFFTHLLNPLAQRRTERNLLVLCMKLCTMWPGDDEAETALYRATKRFHFEAQAAGLLFLPVLQAGILIALYEIGHAFYPAAYLSVGACARYGLALEVDKSLRGPGGATSHVEALTWDEIEETKRVWWAVLILDRSMSLPNHERPLSTENPTFGSYLPVDDAAWDAGVLVKTAKESDAVTISNGLSLNTGSYARLCQSTFLLGQALQTMSHPQSPSAAGVSSHSASSQDEEQCGQLRRTLLALIHAADREAKVRRLEFCAQSQLSLSTILLLQEHYLQEWPLRHEIDDGSPGTVPLFDELWHETQVALERLSSAAAGYNTSCPYHSDDPENIPVFLPQTVYQVAGLFLKLVQNNQQGGEARDKFETCRNLLRKANSRWRSAGVYVDILDARELTASF